MVGFLGVMPVWLLKKLAPSTSSRSAFVHEPAGDRRSTAPAEHATTQWVPNRRSSPLPLNVVSTGALRQLGQPRSSAGMSKRAPWPTMIAGPFGLAQQLDGRIIFSSASARRMRWRSAGDAAGRARSGLGVFGPAGIVCTSSGKIRCETPRLRHRALAGQVSSARRACSELQHGLADHCGDALPKAVGEVDLLKGARAEHLRVDLAGQRQHRCARSTLASHRPVSRFVAPGPAIARQAAGFAR